MKVKVYTIRDKFNGFSMPTYDNNENSAIRAFKLAVNKTDGLLYANSADFDLYEIGEFDSNDGILDAYDIPKLVASAASLKE